jgi:hypothetical protein
LNSLSDMGGDIISGDAGVSEDGLNSADEFINAASVGSIFGTELSYHVIVRDSIISIIFGIPLN